MDSETLREAALTLCEGNPGALRVIIDLGQQYGELTLASIVRITLENHRA